MCWTEPKPRQIGTVYILGLDWLGEGLLIANGNRWMRNRRLLTPAFHFDILQSYIDLKNKAASILVVLNFYKTRFILDKRCILNYMYCHLAQIY